MKESWSETGRRQKPVRVAPWRVYLVWQSGERSFHYLWYLSARKITNCYIHTINTLWLLHHIIALLKEQVGRELIAPCFYWRWRAASHIPSSGVNTALRESCCIKSRVGEESLNLLKVKIFRRAKWTGRLGCWCNVVHWRWKYTEGEPCLKAPLFIYLSIHILRLLCDCVFWTVISDV